MKKIIFLLSVAFALAAFLFIEKSDMKKSEPDDERLESAVGDRDDPGAAFRFRYRMLAGNQENIDLPQLRRDAIDATSKMIKTSGSLNKTAGVTWSALGPGNIGGRVRAIVVNATNSSELVIGSASGGIWKSTDGGSSWTSKSDALDFLAISSMAVDPTNNNVIYAGTGEGWLNLDAVYGGGIYKSTDFGDSWTLLSSTSGTSAANFRNVMKIAADAAGNVYAATKDFQSKYGGGEFTTAGGLYMSSNGGTSWTKISSTDMSTDFYEPSDVIPFSSSVIVYAVGTGGATGGIYRTTDGGGTWGKVASNLPTSNYGRIALAQDPSNQNRLYAVFQSSDVSASGDAGLKGIYKSVDSGATWTQLSTPPKIADTQNLSYLGAQGWYDNVITVDPNNANNIYVGGITMMRTTNGGTSWSEVTYAYGGSPYVHADHHAIVFDKNIPNTIYCGCDGGVYKTTNPTVAWSSLNNGLAITQFYGGAVSKTGLTFFGGTQDNGHLKYSGSGSTWAPSAGGDGGYAAQDQTNDLVSYEEYVYLAMSKTTDGGASWHSCVSGLTDAGDDTRCLFISPFAMSPDNSSVLIAGSNRVWVTTNSAASWKLVSNVLPASSYSISAVTLINAAPPFVAFAGTSDGKIYSCTSMYPDSGSSNVWEPITPTGNNGAWVRRIVVDPSNVNRIFACYGGYNTSGTLLSRHVWESTDQGSTWSDISKKLPNVPIHTLAVDPNSSTTLYVGTETGIYGTVNNGLTWSIATTGMPLYAPTDELVIQKDTKDYFAFTHGRGVFTSGTPSTLTSPGWTVDNSGVVTGLATVKAVSQTVGWTAGDGGEVLLTSNGGSTWNPVGGGSIGTASVYAIDALDANTAFVTTSASSTFIYRTTDGGGTWGTVFTLAGGFIDGIKMMNANNGIAVGDPVGGKWTVAKTTDGGATWARMASEPTQVGSEAGWNNSVALVGNTNVWFGTNSGKVYRTTDGGVKWSSSTVPFLNTLSVAFNDAQHGVAGSDSSIAVTTDGGVTWTPASTGGAGQVFGISGSGSNFFATEGSIVYRSTDYGATWASSFKNSIGALSHINIVANGSTLSGWTVSTTGSIAAFSGSATGVEAKSGAVPSEYALLQNFPNPFNPQTRIQFAIPQASHVSLKVFNSVGEEVSTLVDNVMNAGTHDVDWNGRNRSGASVASGVYFYRVIAGGFVATKKMLLIK